MHRWTWFFVFPQSNKQAVWSPVCVFWLLSLLFFLFKFKQVCLRMAIDQTIIKMGKTFQLNIAPVNTFYKKMSLMSVHLFPASLGLHDVITPLKRWRHVLMQDLIITVAIASLLVQSSHRTLVLICVYVKFIMIKANCAFIVVVKRIVCIDFVLNVWNIMILGQWNQVRGQYMDTRTMLLPV